MIAKIRMYLQVTCHSRPLTGQPHILLRTQLLHSLILYDLQMDIAGDTEKRQPAP